MIPNWIEGHIDESGMIVLKMHDYHARNLRAALKAARDFSSPLKVIETGDWIGEIVNLLDALNIENSANVSAEEIVQRAKNWKPL